MGEFVHRLRSALVILRPSEFALPPFACPVCGPGLLIRLSYESFGVRCLRCGASVVTLSLAAALRSMRADFDRQRVYELSSRGALFEFLRRKIADCTFSEYFDDVPPGEQRDGVPCQDVQRLTFGDACFDICTSTEVFEHVPDDRRGFAEMRRALVYRDYGQDITHRLLDAGFARARIERCFERSWLGSGCGVVVAEA